MTTKAQKIRVGVFAAVTGFLVATVLVVFGGMRFWEDRDEYHVDFDGTVMGLEGGAQVFLNGIRVGAVEDIAVSPADLTKVRVKISVKENTPVHTDTRAMLQMAGITGLKVIDLRGGTLGSPRLPAGAVIAQGETTLDKIEKQAQTLVDQSTELMKRANQIVANLVTISDPSQFEALPQIMAQAKVTSDNLAAMSGTLNVMVAENRVAIKKSITAVEDSAKSATAMLDGQVAQLMANAGDFISELKGLVTNNEGQLRAAVVDLRQASRSFKELAREVRQKPSRLFFSGSPSERKLP